MSDQEEQNKNAETLRAIAAALLNPSAQGTQRPSTAAPASGTSQGFHGQGQGFQRVRPPRHPYNSALFDTQLAGYNSSWIASADHSFPINKAGQCLGKCIKCGKDLRKETDQIFVNCTNVLMQPGI